jgi:hypothetical protein
VRLLAVRRSIKWHETFPRKAPISSPPGSHEVSFRPSSFWSQPVDRALGAARVHRHACLLPIPASGGANAALA